MATAGKVPLDPGLVMLPRVWVVPELPDQPSVLLNGCVDSQPAQAGG